MTITPTAGARPLPDPAATAAPPLVRPPANTASSPTITHSIVYNVAVSRLAHLWATLPAQERKTALIKIATLPLFLLAGVASIVEGVGRTLFAFISYPFTSHNCPFAAARATKQVLGLCAQAFTLRLATPNPTPPAPPVHHTPTPTPPANTTGVAGVSEPSQQESPLQQRIESLGNIANRLDVVVIESTPAEGGSTIAPRHYATLVALAANRARHDLLDRECVALLQGAPLTNAQEGAFSTEVTEIGSEHRTTLQNIQACRRRIEAAHAIIAERLAAAAAAAAADEADVQADAADAALAAADNADVQADAALAAADNADVQADAALAAADNADVQADAADAAADAAVAAAAVAAAAVADALEPALQPEGTLPPANNN